MGALSGIRVIDLSLFLPGPMLTCMMADQGAEVIKIEPPTGDPARAMPPIGADGQSLWFTQVNRGKRSVTLDLKRDSDRDELLRLCAEADVFVEGFRPGVMRRLGFDYPSLSGSNPRLVYCSISAFGQQGTLADHPAHDLVVQALSGFLSVNDGDDGRPVVPGVPGADLAASLTGLAAVLMALLARERTGRGDYIDCAMFDALLPWSAHLAGEALAGGAAPVSARQRSLGGAALYRTYRCKDGRYVALGGREGKFARTLLEAADRPDLIPLALAPAGEQGELIAFLDSFFAQRAQAEWTAWFEGKDVAFAPVLDFAEAFCSDHVRERGLIADTDGVPQFAPAVRLAAQPGWVPRPAPRQGEG
jgi:crotonobetainyl-CoA:carnitine CoA-transferase CaiB-like acyl-CoA transferase